MDELIYLIWEEYQPDAIGQMVPIETLAPIWAHLQSVTRAEWSSAGQNGLQPQIVAITPRVNYSGEEVVQIGEGDASKRYGVYRTYAPPDSDQIELYLERKAGI